MINDFNEEKAKYAAIKSVVDNLYVGTGKLLEEVEPLCDGVTYQGMTGTKLRNLLLGTVLVDLASHYLNGLLETTDDSDQIQEMGVQMLRRSLRQDLDKREVEYRRVLNLMRRSALPRVVLEGT